MIAMLLLTLSFLTVSADQEGNARWCNIDSYGCYLNEEGGAKSYMHFWTVESCRYFMGNDNPCKNVVDFYTEDKYRLPLEPAPEPQIQPVTATQRIISILELYERLFPNGIAIFNGVLLAKADIGGLEFAMSLDYGTEVLIPVYVPKDASSVDSIEISPYRTTDGSLLYPSSVYGVLDENYSFAGFVPAESLNFSQDIIEEMTATPLQPVAIQKDGSGNTTGLMLLKNSLSGGNAGNNSGEISWLKESDGGTNTWYVLENNEGVASGGKLLSVRWIRKAGISTAEGAKFEVKNSDTGSEYTYEGNFSNTNLYQPERSGIIIATKGVTVNSGITSGGIVRSDPLLDERYSSEGRATIQPLTGGNLTIKPGSVLNVNTIGNVVTENNPVSFAPILYAYPINGNSYNTLSHEN